MTNPNVSLYGPACVQSVGSTYVPGATSVASGAGVRMKKKEKRFSIVSSFRVTVAFSPHQQGGLFIDLSQYTRRIFFPLSLSLFVCGPQTIVSHFAARFVLPTAEGRVRRFASGAISRTTLKLTRAPQPPPTARPGQGTVLPCSSAIG